MQSWIFLTDRNIDADDILAFLVENRINCNRGFTRLAVTDDELSLPFADRHHGVDRLDPGLQRFIDRLAHQYAGRSIFNRAFLFGNNGTFAIDRLSECIDNTTDQSLANRYFYNFSGRFDNISFFDLSIRAQNDHTDIVFLQIERHAVDAAVKFEQLALHAVAQTIDSGNAVTDLQYGTIIQNLKFTMIMLDLFFYDGTDFFRS